jgi:hypothetical protein
MNVLYTTENRTLSGLIMVDLKESTSLIGRVQRQGTYHVDDTCHLQHEEAGCVKRILIIWLKEIHWPHINELQTL